MKLFYCPECKYYYDASSAKITIPATVRVDKNGKYYIANDFDIPEGAVTASDFTCNECDGDMEVVTMEEDKCPHQWELQYLRRDKHIQKCRFCGKEKEGKVVWD